MLYYLIISQEKLIHEVKETFCGYGYSLYSKGFYNEPFTYYDNNLLLARLNFENTYDEWQRDVYIDYRGGVFIFDNEQRIHASNVAEKGSSALENLVFDENIGYYFFEHNKKFFHKLRLVARQSMQQLVETFGKPEKYRTKTEESAIKDPRREKLEKKIAQKGEVTIDQIQQMISDNKPYDEIAELHNLTSYRCGNRGSSKYDEIMDSEYTRNTHLGGIPGDNNRQYLSKIPYIDPETFEVEFR